MEDEGHDKFFASFGKAPEFFEKLDILLKADINVKPNPQEEEKEETLVRQLTFILMEYREQAYLLDPFLERIVVPTVEIFKNHVLTFVNQRSSGGKTTYSLARLVRLTDILYSFIKFRGRKTIVNFFPHEVADLTIALDYIEMPDSPAGLPSQWRIRYIALLWLSLVCMIPFDLAKFDTGTGKQSDTGVSITGRRIERLAIEHLPKAGLEREAAATLLSKLFMRADTSTLLSDFFKDIPARLGQDPDQFTAIGLLHMFCEITKSGVPATIAPYLADIHGFLSELESKETLINNTVVRKYRLKLASRLAVGVLPSRARSNARGRKALQPSAISDIPDDIPDDLDIPEEVESTISLLLECLQDKNTDVRYVASKYVARIAERLPFSLSQQILDSVLELFSIYPTNDDLDDLPAVAEPTWHGACLACAEIARRGLVEPNRLDALLEHLKKALLFDIRKGAHSVGSGVRDSAAYVVWALARSQSGEALKVHALSLAQRLVCVSLYDREVHIRRAASAAFQENVGRLGLFPHGIDIISKADFFSVGNRRNSFLEVARQVAEHVQYRISLVEHLMRTTLVHWDPAMRQLGAQSLKVICEKDLENLGPLAKKRLLLLLGSIDTNRIHGALLGFSELATAYKARNDEIEMLSIFRCLDKVSIDLLERQHNGHLISASCLIIANALTEKSLFPKVENPRWKTLVDLGLKHRLSEVQEAAATALRVVSSLVDITEAIERYINDFQKGNAQFQQSIAYALGELSYDKGKNAVIPSMTCLLNAVDLSSTSYSANIETRRNCYISIPKVLRSLEAKIPEVFDPSFFRRITALYLKGLDDYSVDERGDVGSWIRIACTRAISQTLEIFSKISAVLKRYGPLESWLPRATHQKLVGGVLRQGVERLDNVRREAGESFMILLDLPQSPDDDLWSLQGYPLLKELFSSRSEIVSWSNGQEHFPRAVQLLKISAYRHSILRGIILSIGSKTDGTQRPMAVCLANFAASLPVTTKEGEGLTLVELTTDILNVAQSNLSSNQTVIPVLQTVAALLENSVLANLEENESGLDVLRKVFEISTKNVGRLKNIQRIILSGKIVGWLLTIPRILPEVVESLLQFLLHPFPKVRSETAEHLYMVLQAADFGFDTDGIEEILLEADWMGDVETLRPSGNTLITIFNTKSVSTHR